MSTSRWRGQSLLAALAGAAAGVLVLDDDSPDEGLADDDLAGVSLLDDELSEDDELLDASPEAEPAAVDEPDVLEPPRLSVL